MYGNFYEDKYWSWEKRTTIYLIRNIRQLCIQPLLVLDSTHLYDDDSKIDERLENWFKNNQNIKDYGLDILGQPHGTFYNERMKFLKEGLSWDEADKLVSKLRASEEKINIYQSIKFNFDSSNLFNEDVILLFLRVLKKVCYLDFF